MSTECTNVEPLTGGSPERDELPAESAAQPDLIARLEQQLAETRDALTDRQTRINRQRDLIVELRKRDATATTVLARLKAERDSRQSRIEETLRLVNEFDDDGHIPLLVAARLRNALKGIGLKGRGQ